MLPGGKHSLFCCSKVVKYRFRQKSQLKFKFEPQVKVLKYGPKPRSTAAPPSGKTVMQLSAPPPVESLRALARFNLRLRRYARKKAS